MWRKPASSGHEKKMYQRPTRCSQVLINTDSGEKIEKVEEVEEVQKTSLLLRSALVFLNSFEKIIHFFHPPWCFFFFSIREECMRRC